MSVLTKGVTMPIDCDHCKFSDINDCNLWMPMDIGERHPECPLTELPEKHGRLIDADEICFSMTNGIDQDIAEEAIRETPTVIEAEGEE